MIRYALVALTCALVFAGLTSAASSTAKTHSKLVVKVGTNRTYSRTELRPGESVVCRYRGHELAVTAPAGQMQGWGVIWPLPGNRVKGLFRLNVTVAGASGYTVVCALGGNRTQTLVVP